MDDNNLEQPILDDAFDNILNSLDLGDENLTQKLEEKTNNNNNNNININSNINKSASASAQNKVE